MLPGEQSNFQLHTSYIRIDTPQSSPSARRTPGPLLARRCFDEFDHWLTGATSAVMMIGGPPPPVDHKLGFVAICCVRNSRGLITRARAVLLFFYSPSVATSTRTIYIYADTFTVNDVANTTAAWVGRVCGAAVGRRRGEILWSSLLQCVHYILYECSPSACKAEECASTDPMLLLLLHRECMLLLRTFDAPFTGSEMFSSLYYTPPPRMPRRDICAAREAVENSKHRRGAVVRLKS